jgi:5-methylcytosine-specific restriction enzyme subunit McrC
LSRNISENFIHKERFYTAHQVYDRNNIYNRILNKALNILASVTNNQGLIKSARNLQLAFEEVGDINISENTFKNLRYNRITETYRPAIQLARLIILSFSPDLKSGRENIMAILFDMNKLFEKFIYKRLKREENTFCEYQLNIQGQESRNFWQGRSVRPDIILEYMIDGEKHRVIIDTKWKVLASNDPHDSDLQQMFVYNVHFKSLRGVLLYPQSEGISHGESLYEPSATLQNFEHSCRPYAVNLFDKEGRIKKDFGKEIITDLTLICSMKA